MLGGWRMAPKTPGPAALHTADGRPRTGHAGPAAPRRHRRQRAQTLGARYPTSMLPRQMPTRKAAMPEDLDEVAAPEDLEELDETTSTTLDVDVDDELGDDDSWSTPRRTTTTTTSWSTSPTSTRLLTADRRRRREGGRRGEEEEEEEPEDEDVEASLDVILKERLVVEDEPEDEEVADADDRTEGTERVLPKQPDEFVCRSCFLVKHPSQLADPQATCSAGTVSEHPGAPSGGDHEDEAKSPAEKALDLLVFVPAGLVATALEDLPDLAAKGRQQLEGQIKNAHVIGRMVVTLGHHDLKSVSAGSPAGATAPHPAGRPGAGPSGSPAPPHDRTVDVHAHTPHRPRPPAHRRRRVRSAPGSTARPRRRHRPPGSKTPTPQIRRRRTSPASRSTASPGGGGRGKPPRGAGDPPAAPLVDPARRPPGPGRRRRASATPGPLRAAPEPPSSPATGRPGQPAAGELRDERGGVDTAIPGYDTLSASQVVRRLDGLGPERARGGGAPRGGHPGAADHPAPGQPAARDRADTGDRRAHPGPTRPRRRGHPGGRTSGSPATRTSTAAPPWSPRPWTTLGAMRGGVPAGRLGERARGPGRPTERARAGRALAPVAERPATARDLRGRGGGGGGGHACPPGPRSRWPSRHRPSETAHRAAGRRPAARPDHLLLRRAGGAGRRAWAALSWTRWCMVRRPGLQRRRCAGACRGTA